MEGGRGRASFPFCTIKINVINNVKFTLRSEILSIFLSKIVDIKAGSHGPFLRI